MSKPSSTNCPKASVFLESFYSYAGLDTTKNILGGYGGEETPDPIPNSEAKLTSADGTAYCGRVGRRRPSKVPTIKSGSFFVYTPGKNLVLFLVEIRI